MLVTTSKNQTVLIISALVASIIFCIALSIGGITGYLDSLADGKFRSDSFNGITLPRFLATIATIVLSFLYIIWLFQSFAIPRTLSASFKAAAPFLAIAFLTYPLSSDILVTLWMPLR